MVVVCDSIRPALRVRVCLGGFGFYLVSLGLSESQAGLLLSLTLGGEVLVSLFLTTWADRIGRRSVLILGAILMAGAGVVFACTHNFFFLVVAGTIGVISPSGNEVGPFLSIEQAALSRVVSPNLRTEIFAWYTLVGSLVYDLLLYHAFAHLRSN